MARKRGVTLRGISSIYSNLEVYPYFIEFYLNYYATRKRIMSEVIMAIVEDLKEQGISVIGAAVNRQNVAAIRVLERSGFKFKSEFDIYSDFYLVQ